MSGAARDERPKSFSGKNGITIAARISDLADPPLLINPIKSLVYQQATPANPFIVRSPRDEK